MRRTSTLVFLLISSTVVLCAQSTNASLSGRVSDPSRALITGARVTVVSATTNSHYETTTNGSGGYYLTNLPPGSYRIEVEKAGFRKLIKPDVVLHVQDALQVDFEMPVGVASDSITVESGAPLVNTESATVSTVVDRQFVGNIPLNGRSFQSLITLTPGVVLTTATEANPGQFSVNGQRQDANYFMVDGLGANLGIIPDTVLSQVGGGAVPATTSLGGFNNLVSIDALQEFRVMTSSYAPEYGRTPGGQIQLVTRSGTNQFHGSVFEYFRNDVLDANDWFANHNGLPKPKERQNDFGGVFGGRIWKDRTFFFLSYEGLRLAQPVTATTVVPSLAVRQQAVAVMQPFLNAFPQPNGPNLASGFAQLSASYSNPANLDAGSVRVDHDINGKLRVFGRYNRAPSNVATRGLFGGSLNTVSTNDYLTETLTGGATYTP